MHSVLLVFAFLFPQFEAGKNVYFDPPNWRPSGMSARHVRGLQKKIDSLKMGNEQPIHFIAYYKKGDGVTHRAPHELLDQFLEHIGGQGAPTGRAVVVGLFQSADCTKPKSKRRRGHDYCKMAMTASPFMRKAGVNKRHREMYRKMRVAYLKQTPIDLIGAQFAPMHYIYSQIWPNIDPVAIRRARHRTLSNEAQDLWARLLTASQKPKEFLPQDSKTRLEKAGEAYESFVLGAKNQDFPHMERSLQDLRNVVGRYLKYVNDRHAERDRELRELASAQADYESAVSRAQQALNSVYRPDNYDEYVTSLASIQKEKKVIKDDYLSKAATLDAKFQSLFDYVSDKESQAEREAFNRSMMWLFTLLLVLGLLVWISLRRSARARKRRVALRQQRKWEEELGRIDQYWSDVEFDGPKEYSLLEGCKGRAKKTLATLNRSADLLLAILTQTRKVVKEAGRLIEAGNYDAALALYEEVHDLDTFSNWSGESLGTVTLSYARKKAFDAKLVIGSSQAHLEELLDLRKTPPSHAMPHSDYDELYADCIRLGLDPDFLAQHPLHGDDEADLVYWNSMKAIRDLDPDDFAAEVSRFHQINDDYRERLDELIELAKMGKAYREALSRFKAKLKSLDHLSETYRKPIEKAITSAEASISKQFDLVTSGESPSENDLIRIDAKMGAVTKLIEKETKLLADALTWPSEMKAKHGKLLTAIQRAKKSLAGLPQELSHEKKPLSQRLDKLEKKDHAANIKSFELLCSSKHTYHEAEQRRGSLLADIGVDQDTVEHIQRQSRKVYSSWTKVKQYSQQWDSTKDKTVERLKTLGFTENRANKVVAGNKPSGNDYVKMATAYETFFSNWRYAISAEEARQLQIELEEKRRQEAIAAAAAERRRRREADARRAREEKIRKQREEEARRARQRRHTTTYNYYGGSLNASSDDDSRRRSSSVSSAASIFSSISSGWSSDSDSDSSSGWSDDSSSDDSGGFSDDW